MRMALGALAVALVATHVADARAGACAPPSVTATVLTPAGASIDADGGVVVGLVTGFGGTHDDLAKLDWKFADGAKEVAPKATTALAPGLVVLVPDAGSAKLELRAGKVVKATVPIVARVRTEPNVAPAPNVKSIKVTTYTGPRSSGSSTDAALGATPPPGTIAVLVFDPAARKAGKPAKSWASVTAGAKTLQLASSGRCQTVIPGTQSSAQGDKVVLVWVDASGHPSAPSREIEIQ